MAPGTCFSLCFCLLGFLASGILADEEVTHDPLVDTVGTSPVPDTLLVDARESRSKCNMKWVKYGNSCLRHVPIHTTFNDAEDECQSYGVDVHLAAVQNANEGTYISNHIIPKGLKGNVWNGLKNEGQKCSVWKTTDGQASNYDNWQSGQPSVCNGDEACAQLIDTSSFILWQDKDCDDKATFLCRSPVR